MSNFSATASSLSSLDDDAWDDLLNFIEERRVIPIEAASLFDKLPPSMRNLHDVRQWRTRIQQAQGKSVAQSGLLPMQRSAG
jgi:hypothetical protein